MAKIVYGLSGEGSGHSSRSREMLTHLQDLGHRLIVVSYDRGYANLKDDFDVFETEGLHIASLDNRVSRVKTFTDNLQRLPKGHKKLQMLRKPYLALPMRGQFEQEINGFLLARLKYGINLRRTNSEAIGHFLYRLPDFAENLKTYQARDNRAIKARLAELLDDNCALAKEFHCRRTRLIP